jgi:hypothetical protein
LVPRKAQTRTESQSPILEKEKALSKEIGIFERPTSQKSTNQPRVAPPPDNAKPPKRRLMICVLAIGLFAVVLAIILGTVLTVYLTPDRPSPSPAVTQAPTGSNPTPTPTRTPTPTPTSGGGSSQSPRAFPRIASAAVTGWTVPGSNGYSAIWLCWQSTEGYVSGATFNSSTANWTRVNNFAEAKQGTPMAATTLNADWHASQDVRIHVFC